MKKALLFTLVFIGLIAINCHAQDYTWWNQKHNWDGITHWADYIIISPYYLGPNALPVPDLKEGRLKNTTSLELGAALHNAKGDQTVNAITGLYIPLAKNKVGLKIHMVPIEYYAYDSLTRDIRRSRDYDGKGYSVGDLYVESWIKLFEESRQQPGLLLSINLKTASGNNLGAARFTDSPAYYFDLSSGFTVFEQENLKMRAYGMAGIYVYQTNRPDYRQNDAFLFGSGLDLQYKKIILKNQLTAYLGYLGNGDKPIVYRLIFQAALNQSMEYKLQFQEGLHDHHYTSFFLSAVYKLKHAE